MREFSFNVIEFIAAGLRRDSRNAKNVSRSILYQNVRPIQLEGIITPTTFTPLQSPFASGYLSGQGVTVSHPFPQLYCGQAITLLLDETKIYEVTRGTNWTISEMSTRDGYNPEDGKSISAGDSWHIADMGTTLALFNGSCVVIKTNSLSMFGGTSNLLVIDDVSVNTGCAFRGRLVMGGFDKDNFWNDAWEALARKLFDLGQGFTFPDAPDSNYVAWSQIGSDAFWLFYPDTLIHGHLGEHEGDTFDIDHSILMEMVERNEFGFMPMDWQGIVYRMIPFDNGIMVYGSGGITYMPKADNTFGKMEVLQYGIASRSAAGGSSSEHVFVDSSGWLWKVSVGQPPKRLGFKEFFEPMLDNDIVVSYDPIENEYHISDGSICYTLKDNMLFESTFLISSIAEYNGISYAIPSRPGQDDDDYAIIVSDTFDFGLRSIKSIERIAVSGTGLDKVSIAIYWRMNPGDSWNLTNYSILNYEGFAFLKVSGLEFRLVIRSTDYSTFDVDSVMIHFKTDDKRYIRGTYALENVSRTG